MKPLPSLIIAAISLIPWLGFSQDLPASADATASNDTVSAASIPQPARPAPDLPAADPSAVPMEPAPEPAPASEDPTTATPVAPTPATSGPDGSPAIPPAPQLKPGPAPDPDKSPDAAPADGASGESAQQVGQMEASDEGFVLKDAPLNEVFQVLAKSAGRQYFHNNKIIGPEFNVTGHLNDGNPLHQMEELAFMYGLSLHTKGGTIYALTQAQLAQLPGMEFHYQLRYLRPTDIKQIQELIKPMLSPGSGIVNFEPKTNTIIIIDTAHRIEQVRLLLHGIDQAKGQIIVETKILRINTKAAERIGINWSASLGEAGLPLGVSRDLGAVFGLPMDLTSVPIESGQPGATFPSSANLVLNPVQLKGVMHALGEGGIAKQLSNPTLITEDNEQATISIIDRVPIITTTSTANTSGGNPTVTENVRYQIDEKDPSMAEAPDKHREIGISVMVKPQILPDGTVRMSLRPRSAQVTEQIVSITGNKYPRVSESMIETLARVPNGHSLVVGGFYGEIQSDDKTKIPLLGDVPVLNFFFKSKEASKEATSLVFIVTPKSYDPTSGAANGGASRLVRSQIDLAPDHSTADETNPGPPYEPNMARTIRGMKPAQAPYYPLPGEDSRHSNTPPAASGKSRFPFAKSGR